MKISPKPLQRWLALPLPFCFGLAVLISCSQAADAPKDKRDETKMLRLLQLRAIWFLWSSSCHPLLLKERRKTFSSALL